MPHFTICFGALCRLVDFSTAPSDTGVWPSPFEWLRLFDFARQQTESITLQYVWQLENDIRYSRRERRLMSCEMLIIWLATVCDSGRINQAILSALFPYPHIGRAYTSEVKPLMGLCFVLNR